MNKNKINVGFIGCGGMAIEHMKGLTKNPYVSMVAFCDVNLNRARMAAEKFGIEGARSFNEVEEMFEKVEINAAYFCLPPFAHGSEMVAIEHNVPFFVEKPIDLYLDRARKIASAIEKKNIITSVGYMNRYRKSVKIVKEVLQEDPPILFFGGWIGGTPNPSPGSSILEWWIEKEKSGGQFHEQVTHTVDLVRFLCGEVKEVYASPTRGFNKGVPEKYSIEDASVVNMKLTNGAIGSLWASCSANGGGGGVTLTIYANKATALFTGWEHSLKLLRQNMEPMEIMGESNIFEIEDNAFIDAVRLNDPTRIMCKYNDGLKTMEVTMAANISMETGKPLSLPI